MSKYKYTNEIISGCFEKDVSTDESEICMGKLNYILHTVEAAQLIVRRRFMYTEEKNRESRGQSSFVKGAKKDLEEAIYDYLRLSKQTREQVLGEKK